MGSYLTLNIPQEVYQVQNKYSIHVRILPATHGYIEYRPLLLLVYKPSSAVQAGPGGPDWYILPNLRYQVRQLPIFNTLWWELVIMNSEKLINM